MLINDLNLYEDLRNILLQTDRIQESIKKIKQKQLIEVLTEMLKTCQADIMVFLDFIYELEQCETEFEINELLQFCPARDNEILS